MKPPTAAELIRQDLSPQLTRLFIIFGGSAGLLLKKVRPWDGLPRTYEEYVQRLYGDLPPDRFWILNYGLLASVVALIVVVVLWLA